MLKAQCAKLNAQRGRVSLGIGLCALSIASVVAQQQPTFRAGANLVRVDMYATTDGRPVEDLKADEIELREDGVVQNVDSFEHVVVRPAGSQETRVEPNTVEE